MSAHTEKRESLSQAYSKQDHSIDKAKNVESLNGLDSLKKDQELLKENIEDLKRERLKDEDLQPEKVKK